VSGKQILGGEEICDLELDRNTQFRKSVPESSGEHFVNVTGDDKESVAPLKQQKITESLERPNSAETVETPVSLPDEPLETRELVKMPLKLLGPRFQPAPMTSSTPFYRPPPFISIPELEVRTKVYTILLSHLPEYPLIKRDESVKKYLVAETKAIWDSWNFGKQQACEWARARHLHARCCPRDIFFTARRVMRFCRVIGAVPFLPRGEISLDDVDAALIKNKVVKRISDDVERSDIEYVWQVVGQLRPGAVPEIDWGEGSEWVSGGCRFYEAVKGFVERVLSVGRANGVGAKAGAGELAAAIRAHGQELSFLDGGGLDEDIRTSMET
jgi:hypothetical protein